MTKQKLKEKLLSLGVKESMLKGLNKSALTFLLEETEPFTIDPIDDEPVLLNLTATDPEVLPVVPKINSSGWSDYVLGLFSDSEMVNGNPTCVGLRRVLQFVIGPITEKKITDIIQGCNSNGRTTTVVVKVSVRVDNTAHPLSGHVISESEAADVNESNCDFPYSQYPSAMACTRAEARAFRKLLQLTNTVSDEETSDITEDPDMFSPCPDYISDEQINLIDVVCSRCDMSVLDYIDVGGQEYLGDISKVSYTNAAKMIKYANSIQNGKKEKPEVKNELIKDYDKNWRKT